jgi:hypothetical protein
VSAESESEHAAALNFSVWVQGPVAFFLRGGLWLFGFWYLGIYLVLLFAAGFSLVVNLVVLVIFVLTAMFVISRFRRASSPAFTADDGGISLGLRTARAVGRRQLSWTEISQLTISAQPYGSMLSVRLNPGTPPTSPLRQLATLARVTLLFQVNRVQPELLNVLPGPPRHQVPLARVAPGDLRSALSALAPASLPIETLA